MTEGSETMPVNDDLLARADRFAKQGTATDLEVDLAAALRAALAARPQPLGRSNWLYDTEFDMHIPCCTRCGNGPLTGEAIAAGDCGEHEAAVAGSATPTQEEM
jgi:hypothetical protein